MISILSFSCETSPRGSYIFASLAKIPLLLSVAFSGGTGMLSESCSLFHGRPSTLKMFLLGVPTAVLCRMVLLLLEETALIAARGRLSATYEG